MISPAGLKKLSDLFLHAICKQIFWQQSFSSFLHKKEMRRGLRRQSSVFLHAIRKRIFLRQIFSISHKKEMRRGAETAVSLMWFFQTLQHHP
jgi:hypothetical protein